jgi:hypothetical protein
MFRGLWLILHSQESQKKKNINSLLPYNNNRKFSRGKRRNEKGIHKRKTVCLAEETAMYFLSFFLMSKTEIAFLLLLPFFHVCVFIIIGGFADK